MIKTDEQFVEANGIHLAYDTFGNPADPPLLLVMGLGMQMLAWDELFCEHLATKGYRVIRFDNRDIGRSSILDAAGTPSIWQIMSAGLFHRAFISPVPAEGYGCRYREPDGCTGYPGGACRRCVYGRDDRPGNSHSPPLNACLR